MAFNEKVFFFSQEDSDKLRAQCNCKIYSWKAYSKNNATNDENLDINRKPDLSQICVLQTSVKTTPIIKTIILM